MDEVKPRANVCDVCNLTCSSVVQLCEHVMGHRHRTTARRKICENPQHLQRLQYFIDTYLKREPLVGLEYVEELQREGAYKYRCTLCNFHGGRKPLLAHVTGPEHIEMYVRRHHRQLLLHPDSQGVEYQRAMQLLADKICRLYGKETITEIDATDHTPQKMPDYSSDPQPTTPERNPANEEKSRAEFKGNADFLDYQQNGEESPAGFKGNADFLDYQQNGEESPAGFKGNADFLDYQQNGEESPAGFKGNADFLDYQQNGEESPAEFKGNADFLDYLQKFQIQSDTDASIIKQITQNCTRALLRYRQEQEAAGGPQAPGNRTEEGLSVGNCRMVVPESVVPTDAMQMFFNSIKNMEEAEVGDLLQKIAATNPAFRGINVPSAIKYLQATGRLKPS